MQRKTNIGGFNRYFEGKKCQNQLIQFINCNIKNLNSFLVELLDLNKLSPKNSVLISKNIPDHDFLNSAKMRTEKKLQEEDN